MRNVILCLAFLSILALRAEAQSSEHQRTGVQGDEDWLFITGISVDLIGSGSLEFDPSLALEMLYKQRFGLSIELPIVARFDLRDRLPLASRDFAAALGDPSFVLSASFRAKDWRLGVELSYTHPLGIWNKYESDEKRIVSGSGYRKFGASLSAVRYLDPLIAGFAASAETFFDRKELDASSSIPLALTASFFATEALNSIAAVSCGVSQRLVWPRRLDGFFLGDDVAYSLSGRVSIMFSEGRATTSFGLSKLLSETVSPIVVTFGYSLRLGEKGG